MNLKLVLFGKGSNTHLFAQIVVDDRLQNFMIDTGSNLSYLFIEPLSLQKLKQKVEYYTYDNKKQFAQKCDWDGDFFYLTDKPMVIKEVEKTYKANISGVIGLDFMLSNKIILNFASV